MRLNSQFEECPWGAISKWSVILIWSTGFIANSVESINGIAILGTVNCEEAISNRTWLASIWAIQTCKSASVVVLRSAARSVADVVYWVNWESTLCSLYGVNEVIVATLRASFRTSYALSSLRIIILVALATSVTNLVQWVDSVSIGSIGDNYSIDTSSTWSTVSGTRLATTNLKIVILSLIAIFNASIRFLINGKSSFGSGDFYIIDIRSFFVPSAGSASTWAVEALVSVGIIILIRFTFIASSDIIVNWKSTVGWIYYKQSLVINAAGGTSGSTANACLEIRIVIFILGTIWIANLIEVVNLITISCLCNCQDSIFPLASKTIVRASKTISLRVDSRQTHEGS